MKFLATSKSNDFSFHTRSSPFKFTLVDDANVKFIQWIKFHHVGMKCDVNWMINNNHNMYHSIHSCSIGGSDWDHIMIHQIIIFARFSCGRKLWSNTHQNPGSCHAELIFSKSEIRNLPSDSEFRKLWYYLLLFMFFFVR